MKRYRFLIAVGTVVCGIVLGIASCSKSGQSTGGAATGGDDSVLVNLGTNVILPAYQQLASSAAALDLAVGVFVAAPASGTLDGVRSAFKDAYKSWAGCSEFEFGPAADKFLTTHFTNSFPADTAMIRGNVNGGSYVIDGISNYAAQGFPALDFLLYAYGDAAVLAQFSTDAHAAGAKQYLSALSAALKAKTALVVDEWSGSSGYLAEFKAGKGVDAGSSLSLLVNAYVQDFDVNLQNYKIGIPIGVYGPSTLPKSPTKVEGYYSGLSVQLLIAQLQAFQRIYQGAGGAGIEDKVAATKVQSGGGLLSDAIGAQIGVVLSKMQALPETLSADIDNGSGAVQAAFTEVRKLTVLLKVDMSSALGIKISFQDDDGD